MTSRQWSVVIDGRTRNVRVDHGFWSGETVASVDGVLALRVVPGFAGFADHWAAPSEHAFHLGEHEMRVRVTPEVGYTLDLVIDGRSATTGQPVPALPSAPADGLYRAGKVGASIAMIAVPYTIVTTFLFGRFAPEWGPRWFAANDLVLASGTLPLMAGAGLYFVNLARVRDRARTRLFLALFGTAFLAVAAAHAAGLPPSVADAFGPLETRRATIVASARSRPNEAPTVTTTDGASYRWASAFGQYSYPELAPGPYEFVLTSARHRIVAVQPAR
ncbi:MAG TPA: hypothetical protein VFM93_08810 [Candidatus Limnocylindria bacterium]|nr:hypothetical protein [Candidatus Limnocylindria bacterium]